MPILKVPPQATQHTEEHSYHRRLELNDLYYNMKHKHRGLALIFNHENFDDQDLSTRYGSTRDRDRLEIVLTNLKFQVEVYNDLKCKDVFNYIDKVARQDHSQNDCLLITVLTHGELGKLYAKDTDYKLRNLWNYFTDENCPTLAGKPKIFFIQACRGINYDNGITLLPKQAETERKSPLMENASHRDSDFGFSTAPEVDPWTHPDFIICFSTAPEYYSWRNRADGSWFIQSLCDILAERAMGSDILAMLTLVSHKVAVEFESYTPDQEISHGKKAIPTTQSTLTRLLHFNEYSKKKLTDDDWLPHWLYFLIFFFLNFLLQVSLQRAGSIETVS